MSLLMEALRKAEADQRQMQEEKARLTSTQNAETAPPLPESHALPPEPPLLDQPVQGAVPEDRDSLQRATREELQDYLDRPQDLDEIAPLPPRQTTLTSLAAHPAPVNDRQSAANVFSAKAGNSRAETGTHIRTAVLATIAVLLIPLWFGVSWYLQQQNKSSLGLNPAIANYDVGARGFPGGDTPNQSAAAGTTTPTAMAEPTQATGPVALEPAPATTIAPAAAEPQIADTDTTLPTNTAVTDSPIFAAMAAGIPQDAIRDAVDAAPVQTLEITRSTSRTTIDPKLQEAYALFRAGDQAGASQRYQAVIAATPDNRDALLGLAAIALQQQNYAQARSHYQRLLVLNPRDHLARAGLMQSLGSLPESEREAGLRDMLATAPDSAPLHFALGNLFAEQQRWSDAQSAYFNALLLARRSTAEAINPDYAFNLAVSLEQLGQSKAAVEYYREAQNLARTTRGSFDITLLNQRLATLEQTLP